MPAREIFLAPNLLSLVRVLLAPLCFYYFAQTEFDLIPIAILTAVVIVSDFLDGALARRLNQHSRLGLILDPLGDKVCLFAAALALLVSGRASPLFFAIIAAKDLIILLGGSFLMSKTKAIVPSNRLGKFTTAFLACGIGLFAILEGAAGLWPEMRAEEGFLPWIARGGLIVGVFLAVLSLSGYALEFCARLNLPARPLVLIALAACLAGVLCLLLVAALPAQPAAGFGASPWRWL